MRATAFVPGSAVLLLTASLAAPGGQTALPDEARLRAMAARFAPVDLGADIGPLPPNERQALARMIGAARIMDTLFLRQVWAGNESLLLELLRDESPLGRARLHCFLIDKGPWSGLDDNAAFVPGVPEKQRVLDRLKDVPVDIEPRFVTAEALARR